MLSLVAQSNVTKASTFTSFARATSARGWLIGFLVIGLWLAGGAVAVRGQSALDGFDPNANGAVKVVVVQPDGKILIGGSFTALSPNGGVAVTRNRIARLNPDGTLDLLFNPNATGDVLSIAVQADGMILVGGQFGGANSIGGATRNFIARLDATTGAADGSFDPNANGFVHSVALQADGMILAGGAFTIIGGQTRNCIARLEATGPNTGLADLSFDPNANGTVLSIAVQTDGKILAGGVFTGANSIGGAPRNYIARLEATGPNTGLADTFNPSANSIVRSIAVQADGKILAGGDFSGANSIGGQPRNRIARLEATGPNTGLADSFDPNSNDVVDAIAVQPDGKILVGGAIGALTPNGGSLVIRNRIARLNPDGTVDGFNPNTNADVNAIAVQEDGKVLLGGDFTLIGGAFGETRNFIGRVETDGRPDRTLNLSTVGEYVIATAVQADGKIVIGGSFTTVLGVTRNHIARLNTDGTLDTAFNPNADVNVRAIAVQADGKIVVGGAFHFIAGTTRNYIARLNADGSIDPDFNPDANLSVYAVAVQADGQVLAGGLFSTIGGQPRNRIARLDATTGEADIFFNPNPNSDVYAMAVQADGKILVGGFFSTIGGATRNRIARLNADGTADLFDPNANDVVIAIAVQSDGKILAGGYFTSLAPNGGAVVPRNRIARLNTDGTADSFDPNANSHVDSIAVQSDGKILAGGNFNDSVSTPTIGGATRNRIARLDATTGLADSFDPNANSVVYGISLQADGKILVGGEFATIGGQARSLFARLSNDTAALQNLAVTQTTITWTRGGSGSQFTRVTFEYSNNNVNYFPLGSGTASGSNWTRTGMNLSTGQNIYIRARGYHRSGYQNGSESITESVRNAFNPGPTAADATISGRIQASDGTPIPGAIVNLTGTQRRKTITDAAGNYRFDNVETSGFYTVTPSRANYSFGPASRSFSQLGHATEAAFTGTPNSAVVGNVINTPEYFVRQHYLDFLGREPDESGFNFWTDQILSCGPDAGCVERRTINVSAAYFLSIEFQETGGLVDSLYRASYGRAPRYAEFMPDTETIARGVIVGRDQWQAKLTTNKAAFIDAFVQRAEFRAAFDSLSNENYIDRLMEHTGVVFTNAERDALVGGLSNGTLTRAAALQRVAENERFMKAKFNEAFVMMEYFGYLRRDPDQEGYDFWLKKLNDFGGNFERAEMVKAFITSGEYRSRFTR